MTEETTELLSSYNWLLQITMLPWISSDYNTSIR